MIVIPEFIQELISVCLLVLVLLQIAVMVHLLYINHKRYQKDKEFYARIAKQDEEIINTFKMHSISLEEVTEDESKGPEIEDKE